MNSKEVKFEEFLKNKRLLLLYNQLQKIGITVKPLAQTPEHAKNAACSTISIDIELDTWGMTVIDNQEITDEIILHELIHLILFYEGFPVVGIPQWLAGTWEGDMLQFIQNMVLHLEVWRLTEKLGFSESSRYNLDTHTLIIQKMQKNEFLTDRHDPHCREFERVVYIANGMLSPVNSGMRRALRETAKRVHPQEYQQAHQLSELCHNAMPLTPESVVPLLGQIIAPLQLPKESLPVVHACTPHPKLRNRLFADLPFE